MELRVRLKKWSCQQKAFWKIVTASSYATGTPFTTYCRYIVFKNMELWWVMLANLANKLGPRLADVHGSIMSLYVPYILIILLNVPIVVGVVLYIYIIYLYGSWWVYTPLIYHSYSYLPWYSRCIILILCILHYVTTGIWREIRIWREGYHNRWWCNGNIHHIWKQCYIRIILWYYHYRMLFPQSIPWLSDIGNH